MKIWNVEYQENKIRVENSWNGERLFINEELQDEQMGLDARSRLFGKLVNKNGEVVYVKVSLGGILTMKCKVFVDDKLVNPS